MKRYLDRESEISFYHVIIKVPDNTHGNNEFAFNRSHKHRLKEILFWLEWGHVSQKRLQNLYLFNFVLFMDN